MTPTPNHVLLYVSDQAASARFWSMVLGAQPLSEQTGFSLFSLGNDWLLGLWQRDGVEVGVGAAPGGNELGFAVASAEAVDAAYADWKAKDITLLSQPTDMDFGRTFVAADPDGHRLRVYVLAKG